MKWDAVEPARGTYDWTGADRVVAFAEAHGQQVRGHTLVWHSQLPGWLTGGSWTPAQLRTLMTDHITAEAGRYKGRVDHWDVVNEPLNEDGTLRPSLWGAALGESYIADAFRSARAADPAAKLYLNDYSTDAVGAKSDGMYALVKRLLAQGVPVDGVGFQAHLVLGQVPASLETNLRRFAELGVDVAITELDIRVTLPATDAELAQQKADYAAVLRACLAVTRCAGVTVWGFTDSDSWIPDFFPGQGAATPYDENLAPKPAHAGIAETLAPVTPPAPGVCSVTYAVSSQWTGGFTAQVTLRNTGTAPLNGWTVRWTQPALPAGHPGVERDGHPDRGGGDGLAPLVQRGRSAGRHGRLRLQRFLVGDQPAPGGPHLRHRHIARHSARRMGPTRGSERGKGSGPGSFEPGPEPLG